jgi:hypothetical protein
MNLLLTLILKKYYNILKDLFKDIKTLLILVLIVIILFQSKGSTPYFSNFFSKITPPPTEGSIITKIEVKWDTLKVDSLVYIPKWNIKIDTIHDTTFLDIDTLEFEFVENKISPKHKKITVSTYDEYLETVNSKTDFSNNHIKVKVETSDVTECDKITQHIQTLQPRTITIDRISVNKFTPLQGNVVMDGIDIENAIVEFINLHSYDNSKELIKIALDLYTKCSV